MVISIVLNKSNIVEGSNNSQYRFKFKSDAVFKKGDKVAIQKLAVYYSWINIGSANNNNIFFYNWFDTSGHLTKTYDITIQDGNYTIDDLNDYMYNILISRGHFCTYGLASDVRGNSNGVAYSTNTRYVFLELMENSTYFSAQLRSYALPVFSSTPTYTQGTNVSGFE
jgi:hypothetical protein